MGEACQVPVTILKLFFNVLPIPALTFISIGMLEENNVKSYCSTYWKETQVAAANDH